jgi:hypothetical protein
LLPLVALFSTSASQLVSFFVFAGWLKC